MTPYTYNKNNICRHW